MLHHEGLIEVSYTKYHSAWAASDPLSAEAMNQIDGGQWGAIEADADVHNHDTRYYTKTLSDVTFFTPTFYAGFDADELDGLHSTDLTPLGLPIGTIMVWSGTDGDAPTGWHICDGGTYGGYASPDLRDRFVVGAGSTYDPGDTGGPVAWNGTISPTGAVTIADHTLTTDELPSHTHTYTEYSSPLQLGAGTSGGATSVVASTNTAIGEQAAGGGAHGHTGSSISFSSIDPRPPYYSLYYIMKYA